MKDYILFSLSDMLNHYDHDEIKESFQTFECSKELDLVDFLQNKSIVYERATTGRTFLLIDKDLLENDTQFVVMGFFTTSQTSYDISKMSQKKKRKVLGSAVPGRDNLNSFPAFLIGQLGRSDRYSSKDLPGHKILHECYIQLKEVNKIVGGEHVILECREAMFGKFYRNQAFKKMVEAPDSKGLYTLYNRIKFEKLISY